MRKPQQIVSKRHAKNLMDLPFELREQIYKLSLLQGDAICINSNWKCPSLLSLGPTFKDHAAASKIYYKKNNFIFEMPTYTFSDPADRDTMQQLQQMGVCTQQYVGGMEIRCDWAEKTITLEEIEGKVVEGNERQGVENGEGVVKFLKMTSPRVPLRFD